MKWLFVLFNTRVAGILYVANKHIEVLPAGLARFMNDLKIFYFIHHYGQIVQIQKFDSVHTKPLFCVRPSQVGTSCNNDFYSFFLVSKKIPVGWGGFLICYKGQLLTKYVLNQLNFLCVIIFTVFYYLQQEQWLISAACLYVMFKSLQGYKTRWGKESKVAL